VNINTVKETQMEQQNLDAAKAALENQLNEVKNVEYTDWDSLQIAIVLKDKAVANIRMMRQDIEAMERLHSAGKGEVIEMMIAALEEEYKNKSENSK
jgi:hypothetical protein